MKTLPDIYTKLGDLVKRRRMAQELSLEELAWRCDLHLNSIWKIEKAKSEIKLSTLLKIFKELKIEFTELERLTK